MKKFNFPFLVCFVFLLYLIWPACKVNDPCGPPKTDTAFLDITERAIIPYHVNDNLKFLHNGNETWVYIVQTRDSGYGTASYYDGDCGNYHKLGYIKCNLERFATSTSEWNMLVDISYPFGPNSAELEIEFLEKKYARDTWSFINNQNVNLKSIQFNNHNYSKVGYLPSGNPRTLDSLYYNQEFGILKIISGTDTLERIP